MAFNREIWLKWRVRKPCPSCTIGLLIPPSNNVGYLKSETERSKELNSYGGYYRTESVFSLHLKCSNCNETVAVSGFMIEDDYPDEDGDLPQKSITPIAFYPPPKIIHVPESCPVNVRTILNETFGLYWLDVGSCANKIRIAIEVLMDELAIPRTRTNKSKQVELTLHARLELFKKQNVDVAENLMAIKWIGNAGSHFSEIKNHDVLDAYELLEHSLERLYNDRDRNIAQIRNQINAAKKPRN
nr:DUF4145 domain-containing protein [uncultured Arsenicibacter sp.]